VTQTQQLRVQELDLLAQAQGEIALGLIQVYRALGGGWQIRLVSPAELAPRPTLRFGRPH
jgi:outer membrane protein TolC